MLENLTIIDWALSPKPKIGFLEITLNKVGTQTYLADDLGSILSFDPLFLTGKYTRQQQFVEMATVHSARSVQLTENQDVLLAV